jgi:hypothetical protein
MPIQWQNLCLSCPTSPLSFGRICLVNHIGFSCDNDESGSGGTILLRSFIFGLHNASIGETRIKTLLGNEMTHNWPSLGEGSSAEKSRYNKGMTGYYSLRLL